MRPGLVPLAQAGVTPRRLAGSEKIAEDRSEWFDQINVSPRLDDVHSAPRFTALLRTVGLLL